MLISGLTEGTRVQGNNCWASQEMELSILQPKQFHADTTASHFGVGILKKIDSHSPNYESCFASASFITNPTSSLQYMNRQPVVSIVEYHPRLNAIPRSIENAVTQEHQYSYASFSQHVSQIIYSFRFLLRHISIFSFVSPLQHSLLLVYLLSLLLLLLLIAFFL